MITKLVFHCETLAHGLNKGTVSLLIVLLVYLLLLDSAIGLAKYFLGIQVWASLSVAKTVPGLLVLALPLFLWEPACRLTPIDNIVKAVMKDAAE